MNKLKYFLLKTKFENQHNKKDDTEFFELVKHRLNWKEYLAIISELDSQDFFKSREKYLLSEYGLNTFLEWEELYIQNEKDEIAERKKLHNESLLSEWQVKSFWVVFIFGLLGGIYSTYDFFIKDPVIEKKLKQIETDILKNKDTIKELRTIILNQKKLILY
jgi:hypothetical protein